ncbi:MAG: FtsX-like permease family protein [Reichenbachiella sp.]|uniref:ABC transporter permease n=1 Tax=Reichenbachiella sp. TaxID=2184521 RepID=UPI00329953EB
MRIAFKLAYKNLMNAGLRTWLNVAVLAFVFIVILFYKGILEGWNNDSTRKSIDWEYAQGQYRHEKFEPHDMLTIQEAHGQIADATEKGLQPILFRQVTAYPNGRLMNVIMKGIDKNQTLVNIPTASFKSSKTQFPAIIGKRMAQAAQLKIGDQLLIRWQDKNNTYDAGHITIVDIFDSDIPTVDQGQIWMPLDKVWVMTGLSGEATYYLSADPDLSDLIVGWKYVSQYDLLKNLREMVAAEGVGANLMYMILLAIALLAIFDTQVLSIFRRQKEIGTYIALGMTSKQVVVIFTVEGAMYSLFAMVVGGIIGTPILLYLGHIGIAFGDMADGLGVAMANVIYPTYSFYLLSTTAGLIVGSAAIVSFLPARRIAKLNPVLALKGKRQ